MSDNDIKTICEKIGSLQEKILKSKFAETVTESEMLCLILAVRGLNDQKAEIAVLTTAVDNSTKEFLKLHDEYQDQKADIEKLQEVNADLNESLRLAAEANKDLNAEVEEWEARAKERQGRVKKYLAKIERMEQESNFLAKRFYKEGVKDLAERLKANMCHGYLYLDIEEDLFRRDVDNLVAEMTEEWTRGKGDSFSQYGGYVTVTAIEEMTEGK